MVNLERERINRGLSQRQAAKGAGIAASVWGRAEAGESLHPANAKAIADFLGVQVTDIWPLDEEPAAA